jgi:uncharacterized protein YegP (UPF0339 family)
VIADRRKHPREPAEAHFHRLGEPARAAAGDEPCRFEVYRADEVRTTSTRFAGGDWHWRLCDAAGRALVDAGGYRDERLCRDAVAILHEHAAAAVGAPAR